MDLEIRIETYGFFWTGTPLDRAPPSGKGKLEFDTFNYQNCVSNKRLPIPILKCTILHNKRA
jgi:hypothetical protein